MTTPYEKALAAIDAAHALDPNKTTIDGQELPYEVHYAHKCTEYLSSRCLNAPETLRLAIRAQHFRRWEIPRSTYPMTRAGYYSWRTFLKKRQGEQVKTICLDSGFSEDDAERVAALIRKEDLKTDEETQVLEDVACLVFLDDQFDKFQSEMDEDKVVVVVRKTWAKMSEEGRKLALGVRVEGKAAEVLKKALEG